MREGFLLDPDIAYLNHGGYGACSREVFDEYQCLQAELERGPTDFFTRRLEDPPDDIYAAPGLLTAARAALAAFVGARTDDLVFVRNATSGLNAAIRSLGSRPDGEVLTTAHEYGAIRNTWSFVGANLVLCPPEELAARIGPRTRAVFVSHITSPTALVLPVEEICAAARSAGVLSIVDGAHAPGQLKLDLSALGADVYAGDCHKWLSAPKGSGFLWARPEHQAWIAPSSSAGATATALTSQSSTAGRGHSTSPRTSPCRRRSTSRKVRSRQLSRARGRGQAATRRGGASTCRRRRRAVHARVRASTWGHLRAHAAPLRGVQGRSACVRLERQPAVACLHWAL